MTTSPRFTVPRDDRRECALYRIYVLHPVTGKRVLGYIGETGRMPFTRFMEHLYDQPWGDTIIGHPEVDPRVFHSKDEVREAEKVATLTEKPLYSIEYQKGAPHQIPQWTAREQRATRDAAKGRVTPDWAAKGQPVRVDPVKPQRQPARKPSTLPAKWRRRRNLALATVGVWGGGSVLLWLAATLLASWLSARHNWPSLVNLAGTVHKASWRTWPTLAACLLAVPPAGGVRRKKRRRAAYVALAVATLILVRLAQ